MATYQCTAFFKHSDAGWSESYYGNFTGHADADLRFGALMNARLGMMPGTVRYVAVRISAVPHHRDTLSYVPNQGALIGSYLAAGITPDINIRNDAVLFEMRADFRRKNRKFLRGIPDNLVSGGIFTADDNFILAYSGTVNAFKPQLTSGVWQIRTKELGQPAVYTYSAITDCNIKQTTTRKAGRPFGAPVGRR